MKPTNEIIQEIRERHKKATDKTDKISQIYVSQMIVIEDLPRLLDALEYADEMLQPSSATHMNRILNGEGEK